MKVKFEHHRQKVLPFREFLVRLGKYILFCLVLIVFSLLIGVAGYKEFAGLNLVDSFYMSSMILTGMGPVSEITTPAGKLFSSFYALYSGVAFLSVTAVFLSPVIHRILHILHVEDDGQA